MEILEYHAGSLHAWLLHYHLQSDAFWGSVSINIICIWEGLLITTWLPIFLYSDAHYSGCYIFTLSWCSSLTYGAATEPRASYVLQPYVALLGARWYLDP